ncbi:MAG: hypothetical protein DME53_07070 [Verrucomicrobia bacterium]|nr:MAG: hypothetical protein DME53_07070 [Verrucomicrobiota bacterium]
MCIGIRAIEPGVKAPRIPPRGIELACPLNCAVAIEAAKTHATTQPRKRNFLQFIALQVSKDSNPQDPKVAALEKVTFSRSFSMARQFLTAKERNSAQRGANLTWPRHLASATVRKPVKTRAKNRSSIRDPLLCPAELRAQKKDRHIPPFRMT